ncbi:alkaline phosphatase family protein [Streptosporangiaceae bacterium NEAU-GS5]|nr:alkaline phosphatase family protein [Streptosporangiaceae bacterium NEAU-GS5]
MTLRAAARLLILAALLCGPYGMAGCVRAHQITMIPPRPSAGPTAAAPTAPSWRPTPKVLVVGLDGLRWDRIFAARAPHMRALMHAGVFATGSLRLPPKVHSVSGPGWATILTGVEPAKHGVRDNSFAGQRFSKYPDFLTRIERLRPRLRTAAVTGWSTVFDAGAIGKVDWHATIRPGEHYEGAPDAVIVRRMVDVIGTREIDVAFMHLAETDRVAHESGVLGPRYTAAIEVMDGYLGSLFAAIRRRPSYPAESWTVIVVTDHGHLDKGGHGGRKPGELKIFLLAAGEGIAHERRYDARQVDVAATVFDQLGIPRPADFDGHSLRHLEKR